MRIALSALQQRHYLTGTGRYIQEIVRLLPDLAPEDQFLLYLKPDQVPLFPQKSRNYRPKVMKNCPSNPIRRSLWELRNFSRVLRNDEVDLYHGPANFLPPRKVCPYLVTMHDMVYFHNPERTYWLKAKYWQVYLRATWKFADLILTVSEYSKGEIMKYLPVPPERIRVIPNGVDEHFFEDASESRRKALRKKFNLDDEYVLYVGRLDPDKNLERTIEAYAQIVGRGRNDLLMVLAGARDYGSGSLPRLIERLGLQERVRLIGHVEDGDLAPLYQEAAAFCYPSLNEGFGLPVLEAMAAGTPVVTSNISSLPEVAGEAGLLVDPYSVEDIAGGLARALDPAEAPDLSAAGRERARTMTWRRSAEKVLRAYRDVMSS